MDQDNIHPFWAEIASRAAGCIAVGIG